MKRVAAGTLLLVGACSWSNSLYQARAASAEALKAEREERPGDAQTAWGRAATKAESAYARGPASAKAAEALWLQGRAQARGGDCVRASVALERSALLRRNTSWREPLLFELARCREALQDRGAVALFEQLASSRDTALRRVAQRRAGDALIRDGQWEEALAMLRNVEEPRVRLNRAIALAALGRDEASLAELRPLLTSSDTTLDYTSVLEMIAARSTARSDELLQLLAAGPLVSPDRESRWLLAAVRGSLRNDPEAADLRLGRLLALPSNLAVRSGALLAADRIVARAVSPADLRLRLDSLSRVADEGLARSRAQELRRIAVPLLAEERATAPGVPRGDLVLFALGEIARDSLAAPQLAAWLFARIERDWPESPYRAKSLLARLPLLPDSGEVLRSRLAALPPNPYLAYLRGQQDAAFVRLEDSLRAYVLERARAASGRKPVSSGDAPDRP